MDGLLLGIALVVSAASAHASPPMTAAWEVPAAFQLAVERPVAIATLARPETRTHVARPSRRSAAKSSRLERLEKIAGGAIAGMVIGGFVGKELTKDCVCDSPGLQGILVGVPLGAAIGALVVWSVSR